MMHMTIYLFSDIPAQFSSKLIASSGALYRYINHDRLRMPEKSDLPGIAKKKLFQSPCEQENTTPFLS